MLIHRRSCHFATDGKCDLGSKVTCVPCAMYIRNIRDLDRQGHISIALAREAGGRARWALIVSFLSLGVALGAFLIGTGIVRNGAIKRLLERKREIDESDSVGGTNNGEGAKNEVIEREISQVELCEERINAVKTGTDVNKMGGEGTRKSEGGNSKTYADLDAKSM